MKKSIFILITIIAFSCTNNKSQKLIALQTELDNLKSAKTVASSNSKSQIATFFTFQKEDAEKAMNFYLGLFDNSKIINIKRWGKDGPGKEGTIMHATFTLNGKQFMCSDSPPIHDWGFTPASSNYVECLDENQLESLFAKLSEKGKVMMPLNNYGFSKKFGFVEDEFGISWQLNLQ